MKNIKTSYLININSFNLLIIVKADQFEVWFRGGMNYILQKEHSVPDPGAAKI